MGAGAFDLLKTRGSWPRSAKQPEPGLSGLRTILSIRPDPAVLESATASSGCPGRVAGDGAMFTIPEGARVIELTLPGELSGGRLQRVLDRSSGMPADSAHLTIRPGDQLSGGWLSSRKVGIRCGAAKISYYDCLFLCLGQGGAVFSIGPVGIGLFLATLSPDAFFRDLFGPVADLPHIEGIRGVPAFVFLTCVI
jgi:hypothetical protein